MALRQPALRHREIEQLQRGFLCWKSRKFRRRITYHFVLDSSSQPYPGRRRAIALALYGYYLNFSYPEGQIRCLVLYRPSFHFIFLYLTTGTACICVGSDLLHWDQHLHCGLVLVVSHLRISQASIYLAHLSISFNSWYGQKFIGRTSLLWSCLPFSLPVLYLTKNAGSAKHWPIKLRLMTIKSLIGQQTVACF